MRKILLVTALPLAALCLPLSRVQATEIGASVPKATGAGQTIYSGSTAPFLWQPVTLPFGLNATGQMSVGGAVDPNTRLSVTPSGASEKGLAVTMPTGSTAAAVTTNGTVVAAGFQAGTAAGQTVTVMLPNGAGTLTFVGGILTTSTAATVPLVNTAEQGYPEAISISATVNISEQGYPEGTG